ncbi:1-deoxy-D-xylulose-5-phosphate reductoisomerase [Aestuariibacter sp. AA17]|uniref:1-deoxy-D-xylulose 5-phosphate reductoisomerase n=1 Tax=Fluctibacter corallii TaxID=2984329 RepID=A0ABT3A8H5_9ALTE|nr:1-deoxy-D-xylulose-5-phosphate reductoisomerase [Aestuariibacter sp. AA17]MCV2884995.1 1-deoxy-D-xylulose-5-phosphate reductoisomerase [Aestuariibacter sp. AA17]
MQGVTVLGATGSIGESTLDVIGRHPDKYNVVALTAHKRLARLVELAKVHKPDYIVAADQADYVELANLAKAHHVSATVLAGESALSDVASMAEADIVMAAIVGAAGLLPTLAAVKQGKKVLLANKESLVMSGQLFIQAVNENNATLLPIDSEHNAIFQCLPSDFKYGDLASSGISKILLTGSGGPFLNTPLSEFPRLKPEQACAHPNWDMGRKISVDSATMMNKGLEFIEACWLFGLRPDDVEVVLHPQSVIHSMVQYNDGSVLAQMGNPDMRTPIAHCLAWPQRIESGVKPLDFSTLSDFSFLIPDFARYPNLKLAIDACKQGQFATTSLNASNEIAVMAFLNNQIAFTDIGRVNETVLSRLTPIDISCIDTVLHVDRQARELAMVCVKECRQ